MSSVCFIVPVYNAENYIYNFEKNIVKIADNQVFVFINDSSVDRSRDILTEICNRNINCYLLDMPYNSGQSRTRNRGIDFIRGNLPNISHVSFLDIDDTVSESYFEDLHSLHNDTVYVKSFTSYDSNGELIDDHKDLDNFYELTGTKYLQLLVQWKATVSACNKFIPISKLSKFVENTKEEDTIHTFELAIKDPVFQKSDYGSYNYCRHLTTSTGVIDVRIFDLFYVLSYISDRLNEIGQNSSARQFRSYWLDIVLSDRLSKATMAFRICVLSTLLFSDSSYVGIRRFLRLLVKSSYQSYRRRYAKWKKEQR